MTLSGVVGFQRSQLAMAALRSAAMATFLLVLYALIPVAHHHRHEYVALRLGVALAFFVAVLANEIRAIQNHDEPMLRAGVSMATVIPLFLVLFAWIYLTMSKADPGYFNVALDRTEALYFTVTIFSTVGFGDIVPKADIARTVVMVQMMADLAVIAVVVRLIFGAASRGVAQRQAVTE
jgi:hypothetical protein